MYCKKCGNIEREELVIFEGLVESENERNIADTRGESKKVLRRKTDQTENDFLLECMSYINKHYNISPIRAFTCPGDYTRQWLISKESATKIDEDSYVREGTWYLIADIR